MKAAGRLLSVIVLAMAVMSAMAVPSACAAEGVDNDQGTKVIYSYTCDFAYEGTDAQSIEWDFGFTNPDGSRAVSDEWNPSGVKFPAKGQYTVTQTVSNTVGSYVSQIVIDIRGTPEVTFDSTGGSPVPMQLVKAGLFADRPADPVREGYTFGGWFTDAACTSAFDWARPIDAHVMLYAKWTAHEGGSLPDENADGGDEGGDAGGAEGGDGGEDGGDAGVGENPDESGEAGLSSVLVVAGGIAGLLYVFSRPPRERNPLMMILFAALAVGGGYCIYAGIDIFGLLFGGAQ